jgi:hypothetical protein
MACKTEKRVTTPWRPHPMLRSTELVLRALEASSRMLERLYAGGHVCNRCTVLIR